MTLYILPLILLYSLLILAILFFIDLKTRLLPNKFVLQFFFCGIAFHVLTGLQFASPANMIVAAILGGGLMLLVRELGNRIYKTDTLGMGDVKLIGAAGIWLGTDYIFLAISLGGLVGIIHGIIHVVLAKIINGASINFATLSIPAGPGFIIGIVLIALMKFHTLPVLINEIYAGQI